MHRNHFSFRFFLLFAFPFYLPFLSFLFSHPSQADRQIRLYYHCGSLAHTKKSEEGRGGLSSFFRYVLQEEESLARENGRTYFLFPFSGQKTDAQANWPYHGIWDEKKKVEPGKPQFALDHRFGDIRLAISRSESFSSEWDLSDYDAIVLFAPPEEKKSFPAKPDLPFFLIQPEKPGAKLQFLGSVHSVSCPTEFGKLGEMDFTFRGRDLIRFKEETISINLTDRNRSWKGDAIDTEEKDLPEAPKDKITVLKSKKPKDKETATSKTNIPAFVPYSYVDREILGIEKGLSTTPSGRTP